MTHFRTVHRGFALLACGLCIGACSDDASRLHFRDVTARTGLDFTLTSGRDPATQILEVKGSGLALFDADGDGDLDLFVPNGATLDSPHRGPGCRLFANQGGLRFEDVTAASGLEYAGWGFGVAVGDYDGDGDDDLFVASFGQNALLRNEGGGKFSDATEAAGVGGGADVWSTAAAFGDADGDGDLDLYVANFLAFDPAAPPPHAEFLGAEVFAGPKGLPPLPDDLYENRGDGTFVAAGESSGIRSVEPAYGLGVVMLDFDGDGRTEILVGNDSMANYLFTRGADGRFVDAGFRSGLAVNLDGLVQATMGIAVADVNGDGVADVHSTNFMNDNNTLHVSDGPLTWLDRTQVYGLGAVSKPFLGWATAFADFDLDGDEDLLVVNGHTYPPEITEPRGWRHLQEMLLFERAGERFTRVTGGRAGACIDEPHCDRNAVFGDLDRDGDVDVIVGERNGPLRVLENDGAHGDWLVVALEDDRPGARNRRGLGAKVVVRDGDREQVRWICSNPGFQSASAAEACFGFGPSAGPRTLEVTWPDGHVTRRTDDVPVGQRLLVRP